MEPWFTTKNQAKKFAKFMTYLTTFYANPDWEEGIEDYARSYSLKQIKKLGIPNGWHVAGGEYSSLKKWFIQNVK